MVRATSYILLESKAQRHSSGHKIALTLALIAVIATALEAWVLLGRENVVADLAIRMASAIAITTAALDASEARRAWAAAQSCIRAIETGQPERALRLALVQRRLAVFGDSS